MLEENNNQKRIPGILVITLVLVLLGVGLFYVVNSGMFTNPAPANPGNGAVVSTSPAPKLVKVDFSYKVKSITAETIVLAGKNGDFTLPNDAVNVKAYKGLTKDSPTMPLTSLKVGDSLNMEFVPGKSATLFVSTM
ncbi:hypothetical protein COT50_03350 [candidate division WWE3 bacterium CG08_land_8_20_14_0_20_41_10]|uniref:Uncharacterized protein n=1 Tax=candidate division WWE3 bacterium CG08_land_8_20_14_0_20_41_10 TaxID=1975085 RepID=A0A2H0XB64_UNCKA|nr:MAG: hypothetical protein COT50_03350 [candidate division WWE3 bacterium CG08_land_8_20_14_0_20_41_10]